MCSYSQGSEVCMDGEWSIESSMSVPKDVFGLLKAEGGSVTSADSLGAGLADKKFHAKQLADRFELPLHVRKILFKLYCEEIPISENQPGYFSDLETIECFRDIVRNKERQHKKRKLTH